MVNVSKLKGKIIEKGMNITELGKSIGIGRSKLYRKLENNGEKLSIQEAGMIVKTLGLTADEAASIFFN